jgi:hypothetical protein
VEFGPQGPTTVTWSTSTRWTSSTPNFWELAAQGKALPLQMGLVDWAGLADLGWS